MKTMTSFVTRPLGGPRFRSLIGDGQKYTVEKVDLQAGLQKVMAAMALKNTGAMKCHLPCGTDMGVFK